jgi:hypothetical protein
MSRIFFLSGNQGITELYLAFRTRATGGALLHHNCTSLSSRMPSSRFMPYFAYGEPVPLRGVAPFLPLTWFSFVHRRTMSSNQLRMDVLICSQPSDVAGPSCLSTQGSDIKRTLEGNLVRTSATSSSGYGPPDAHQMA